MEAGEFHPFNTRLHGIGPADVAEAPCFDTVWAQAGGLVGDLPLVAHNAAFDMGVLKALFGVFGIPEAPRRYLCSCLLARRVWPQRPTYSLGPFASSELGISFRHHDALEDARTCGKIVTAACALRGCDSLDGLAKDVGLRLGRLGVHACTSTQAVRKPVLESEGVFTGKTVVFTGTLGSMSRRTAVRQVVQNGGPVIDKIGRAHL